MDRSGRRPTGVVVYTKWRASGRTGRTDRRTHGERSATVEVAGPTEGGTAREGRIDSNGSVTSSSRPSPSESNASDRPGRRNYRSSRRDRPIPVAVDGFGLCSRRVRSPSDRGGKRPDRRHEVALEPEQSSRRVSFGGSFGFAPAPSRYIGMWFIGRRLFEVGAASPPSEWGLAPPPACRKAVIPRSRNTTGRDRRRGCPISNGHNRVDSRGAGAPPHLQNRHADITSQFPSTVRAVFAMSRLATNGTPSP